MSKDEGNDVDAETERVLIEFWRNAPGWRKLQEVARLNEKRDSLILADIKKQYPRADEAEIQRHFAKRKLPPDLYQEYFGTDDNRDE